MCHLPHPAATAWRPPCWSPCLGRQIGPTVAENTAGSCTRLSTITAMVLTASLPSTPTFNNPIAKSCEARSLKVNWACGGYLISGGACQREGRPYLS